MATVRSWKALARLKPGKVLNDPEVRGLRYIGSTAGTYAQLRYKDPVSGKWRSKGLGRVPDDKVEIAEAVLAERGMDATAFDMFDEAAKGARREARALKRKLRQGLSPDSEAGEEGYTLRQALALHVAKLRAKRGSEQTIELHERLIRTHLSDWLDSYLARITPEMMNKRHAKIAAKTPPIANRTFQALRTIWNKARALDRRLEEFPTGAIDWHRETGSTEAIPLAQLPQWHRECLALDDTIRRDFFLLSAFTGLRDGTAKSIAVKDINLAKAMLHVPNPKGGNERAFWLPLSDYLVSLIRGRIADNEHRRKAANERRAKKGLLPLPESPWLFPAQRSESGHLIATRARAGEFSVKVTVHGLRATYASAAEAAGVGEYHLKLLLNHAIPRGNDVTGRYISPDVDALRPSQQKVTDWLLKALKAEGQVEAA